MEEAGVRYAASRTASLIEQGLAPLSELFPSEGIDIGTSRQKLKSLITCCHNVGGLHPWDIIQVVFSAQQACLQIGLVEFPICRQVINDVGHVHHRIGNRWEGPVHCADQVYLALAALCSSQHEIDQRAFF